MVSLSYEKRRFDDTCDSHEVFVLPKLSAIHYVAYVEVEIWVHGEHAV